MTKLHKSLILKRAGSRIRTDDLLITNQLLYQLSYAGLCLAGGRLVAIGLLLNRNLCALLFRWPIQELRFRIRSIPGSLHREPGGPRECHSLGWRLPNRSQTG
jgi:hypothetical protein